MKKALVGLAIAGVAALALSGCSDPGTGGGASAAPAAWPAQDASLEGTTLTIWAAQNSNKIPDSVVAGFEELTGATVEVVTIPDPYEQSVQTKVASGDKPDLAFWQPTASMLTALNASTNLQSLEGAPFIDSYQPALRDVTGILDDTRYAALISTPAVEGVYYNKEVFEAAGITDAAERTGTSSSQVGPRPQGRRRHAVLRLRRRNAVGDPVVGAGPARRRREGRPVGSGQRERGEVHRRHDPGRDRHLRQPHQGGPVQREPEDGDVRRPGRGHPRRRRGDGGSGELVLRPASVAGRHRRAGREDRLLPDLAERQRRHVHPRPVQRARRLQDR